MIYALKQLERRFMKQFVRATAVLMVAHAVNAQYAIEHPTISAGGGALVTPTYAVVGTIGQPAAGSLAGGTYALQGGFWAGQTGESCPGDVNGSQTIDLDDLQIVLFNFGQNVPSSTQGDLDGSGTVDLDDLQLLLFNFGMSC
ncbi:MAG: hypothetical protein KDA20_05445 [Phycisphaerales bacterium]|nr:hypothetical protein [Phycisphaerales bacterium]